MTGCFAPGCRHDNDIHHCKFFRFPKDIKLLKEWIKLVRRQDKTPTYKNYLCSCHFEEGKKENMPTIFSHNMNKIMKLSSPKKERAMAEVVIVGAGIVGLTTALQLQTCISPPPHISIVADKFTKMTTSSGAAGIFRPSTSFSGPSPEITKKWIIDSYEYYSSLLNVPNSGVSEISGYIFSSISPSLVRNHYLEGLVKVYRSATPEELKLCPGNWKYGSYFTTLLIQCQQFLPWATMRLKEQGVEFIYKRVDDLNEFYGKCDVLVNCSGLGSRELAGDHQLVSIRGQIFKMKADWLDKFYYGDFDTYIIPTGGGLCTVGGSRHYDSYSTQLCRHDGAAIMERAVSMLPKLADSQVLYSWVGLRPHRHQVRVEEDISSGLKIVHNYGHGGYGVTTAPGTAIEAVRCVQRLLCAKSHL